MITITQLEYIVAVERYGNFRLAAKSCFVTQPTLSMQIQKLEDELGVMIFDRSRQPISPTPIGEKIIAQSRSVLRETAAITELINREQQRVEGELRVAIIPTLAPYLLPLFLQNFTSSYPGVTLHVEESKTDDITRALRQNQLDVGILVTPLGEDLLRELPLFQEPFYVYASESSELAPKKEVVEEDLKSQGLLLLTEGHCMREQMLKVCRGQAGPIEGQLQFESGSIETLCHLVENGHGYTVIPYLAKTWLSPRSGRIIPFANPQPSREVSLVVHKSYVKETLLDALRRSIQDALPSDLKRKQKNQPLRTVDIKSPIKVQH